jgi:hypothetical protein
MIERTPYLDVVTDLAMSATPPSQLHHCHAQV